MDQTSMITIMVILAALVVCGAFYVSSIERSQVTFASINLSIKWNSRRTGYNQRFATSVENIVNFLELTTPYNFTIDDVNSTNHRWSPKFHVAINLDTKYAGKTTKKDIRKLTKRIVSLLNHIDGVEAYFVTKEMNIV